MEYKLVINESVNYTHEVIIKTTRKEGELDALLDDIESGKPENFKKYIEALGKFEDVAVLEYTENENGESENNINCEEFEEVEVN